MALPAVSETPPEIAEAIRKASKQTGTDFNYLLKTAERESSFSPRAKARTSSAAGLFQFIESTWLQMVKTVGHRFERRDGSYHVAHARQNADYVRDRLGREPTSGELYIAHFLGARQGTRLIELAQSQPNARADIHFSRAAKANQSIFYRNGRPRTLADVYQRLTSQHGGRGGGVPPTVGAQGAEAVSSHRVQRVPPLPLEAVAEMPLPIKNKAKPIPITRVAALDAQLNTGVAEEAGLGGVGIWAPIVKREAPARAEIQTLPFEVEDSAPEPAPKRRRAVQVQKPQADAPAHGPMGRERRGRSLQASRSSGAGPGTCLVETSGRPIQRNCA